MPKLWLIELGKESQRGLKNQVGSLSLGMKLESHCRAGPEKKLHSHQWALNRSQWAQLAAVDIAALMPRLLLRPLPFSRTCSQQSPLHSHALFKSGCISLVLCRSHAQVAARESGKGFSPSKIRESQIQGCKLLWECSLCQCFLNHMCLWAIWRSCWTVNSDSESLKWGLFPSTQMMMQSCCLKITVWRAKLKSKDIQIWLAYWNNSKNFSFFKKKNWCLGLTLSWSNWSQLRPGTMNF